MAVVNFIVAYTLLCVRAQRLSLLCSRPQGSRLPFHRHTNWGQRKANELFRSCKSVIKPRFPPSWVGGPPKEAWAQVHQNVDARAPCSCVRRREHLWLASNSLPNHVQPSIAFLGPSLGKKLQIPFPRHHPHYFPPTKTCWPFSAQPTAFQDKIF